MKVIAEAITAVTLALSVAAPVHIEGDVFSRMFDSQYQGAEQVLVVDRGAPARPSPNLEPIEVVRIMVEALRENDAPYENAGIEMAFTFSSPANRENSGPLPHFIEVVHNDMYSAMLNHQHARFGTLEVYGDEAFVPVVIVSEEAVRHGFSFRLIRQEGGAFDGCWMIESVLPFEIAEIDGAPLLVAA